MPRRPRGLARALSLAAALVLLAAPAEAAAQLRPLDPIRWRPFTEGQRLAVEAGGSGLRGQRASLAGTEGDLWEAATFSVAYRTGRVVVEAGGTGQRFYRERSRFAAPDADVAPAEDGRRRDSGDYRIQTVVRLTPDASVVDGALRFGTRLPTTDNTTGLDRDATDFFFTLGGRTARGIVAVDAEAGLGIFGTRKPGFEQDDLLLYTLGAEMAAGPLVPSLRAVGQKVGAGHTQIRGNESLGELRLGLRAGTRRWVRAELVRGYEPASPRWGVILWLGAAR